MFSANDVKDLREKTGAGIMDCKKALQEANGDITKAIDWLREKGIAKAAKKESRIAADGLSDVTIDGKNAVIVEVNSETDFVAKNKDFIDFVKDLSKVLVNSNKETVEEALSLPFHNATIQDSIVSLVAKIGEKISFRRFTKVTKSDTEYFGSYLHMGGKIGVLVVIDGGNETIAKDIAMHVAAMNPNYLCRDEVPADVLEHEKKVAKEQALNEGKNEDIAEKMVAGRINKFYKEVCLLEQAFIKDPDMNVETYAKNNGATIKQVIRYAVGEGIEKKNEDFATEVMNQING